VFVLLEGVITLPGFVNEIPVYFDIPSTCILNEVGAKDVKTPGSGMM
jgi:hypothetical protein